MFKSLINITSAYKFIRNVAYGSLGVSLIICCVTVKLCFDLVAREREKIYVLDSGKSLILALSQDIQQNRPVEARSHVQLFHDLFFTLAPDHEAINGNIKRALFLADKTAYNYHMDLLEHGFYKRLISNNIRQRVVLDSISLSMDQYPYEAVTYGELVITRESNITRQSIVTRCQLSNSQRSDVNPHGLLIEKFSVEKIKEIDQTKRN